MSETRTKLEQGYDLVEVMRYGTEAQKTVAQAHILAMLDEFDKVLAREAELFETIFDNPLDIEG